MKTLIAVLLIFSSNLSFSQQILTSIEYDGVYAEIAAGKYIKLPENRVFQGIYIRGGLTHRNRYWLPKVYFSDQNNVVNIPSFKKLIFKGVNFKPEVIRNLSIHPGELVSKMEIQAEGGVDWNTNPRFHVPKRRHSDSEANLAKQFTLTQKTQYQWEASINDPLAAGEEIIAWINGDFWIFTSQTAYTAPARKTTHAKLPANDGVFLKLTDNTYAEIDTSMYWSGNFSYFETMGCGGKCFRDARGANIDIVNIPKSYYYLKERFNPNKNKFPKAKISEIIVKGNSWDVEKFVFYKNDEINVSVANKCVLLHFENGDKTHTDWEGKTIYRFGTPITCTRKTESAMFTFKPEQTLEPGIYTICIGGNCRQICVTAN